jgi:hypothetical protein
MLYHASSQESARSISIGALFPLREQTQWPVEPETISVGLTNWPSFTVALQEPVNTMLTWQEIGASTVRVSQAEIEWLERLYTFRERAEVLAFLERHPFLVSLLLEAYGEIGNYFSDSPIFLEVVTDPEAFDDHQLAVSIATNLDPDEAIDTLEQFDENWWLDALDQAQGKLCIDVEFR